MTLKPHIQPDRKGKFRYPHELGAVPGAALLHIIDDTGRPACGDAYPLKPVAKSAESRPVCYDCRVVVEARKPALPEAPA